MMVPEKRDSEILWYLQNALSTELQCTKRGTNMLEKAAQQNTNIVLCK